MVARHLAERIGLGKRQRSALSEMNKRRFIFLQLILGQTEHDPAGRGLLLDLQIAGERGRRVFVVSLIVQDRADVPPAFRPGWSQRHGLAVKRLRLIGPMGCPRFGCLMRDAVELRRREKQQQRQNHFLRPAAWPGVRPSFLHDRPLAIAVLFSLQAIVHGREADVRLGELRRFLYQAFERLTSLVQLARCERDGGELVSNSRIAGRLRSARSK